MEFEQATVDVTSESSVFTLSDKKYRKHDERGPIPGASVTFVAPPGFGNAPFGD